MSNGINGISALTDWLWDKLFPQLCRGCGYPGAFLCPACKRYRLRLYQRHLCHVCHQPVSIGLVHVECAEYSKLDGVWVCLVYDQLVKMLVSEMKYKFVRATAFELGSMLYQLSLPGRLFSPETVVTSVPQSLQRTRWRGYDHGREMAQVVARRSGAKYQRLLIKKKHTKPQKGLDAEERRHNLDNSIVAFCDSSAKVLLVDDVMTTGATLEACAEALKRAGAQQVIGLVLARGV